jgi:hypothetical protein
MMTSVLKGITITMRTPQCTRAARPPLRAKDTQAQ